jgi:hypothetical protein
VADPWDAPPFPKHGNKTQKSLFEAIGRALTTWEELESFLSHLYAALCEKSASDEVANFEYGQVTSVPRRMDELNRVGSVYFIKHPNQSLEGDLNSLIIYINGWSGRRNDIAHGVVRLIELVQDPYGKTFLSASTEWCLVPPHFKEEKYIRFDTLAHILTSREINAISKEFWPLIRRVFTLCERVELPRFALQRRGALPPPSTGSFLGSGGAKDG